MRTALVVPTIREKNIREFLKAWDLIGENWDHIIVVEDNPEKTFNVEHVVSFQKLHHYSWREIDAELGDKSWIISRRDSSIRSFGFLMACRFGADYIFTLDDDCLPISPLTADNALTEAHIKNLTETPKWIESVPGQRTRGLPYKNKGVAKNVVMSVGMWEGVPDFDAIQTLSGENQNIALPETSVMPMGQYMPICGMNLAFKREIAVACYFPLQGEGYPYRRFDDIWMGVMCKKICDQLGLMVTRGRPYIHHSRASDPFVNLVKEAPGVHFHEEFWELIDSVSLYGKKPRDCMDSIAWHLCNGRGWSTDYTKKLGEAIYEWSSLFQFIG